MGGPWEKYKNTDGPWAKYAKPQPAPQAQPETSAGESALDHFANGASAGYLPQIESAIAPAVFKAYSLLHGTDVQPDDYVKTRDEVVKRLEKEKAEHPIASGAGEIGGGLTTGLAAAPLMPEAAAGAGLLSRLGTAAKVGAMYGAAVNPGDQQGELSPIQPLDRLKNAGIGAAAAPGVELGLSGATALGGKAANAAGQYLGDVAESRAFKALGGVKKANDEALARGNRNEIGRQALDEGVVTPLASKDTMLERSQGLIQDKAAKLQDAIKAVMQGQGLSDEQKTILEQTKFDPQSVANRLKAQLKGQNDQLPEKVLQPRLDGIDQWLTGPPKDIQQTQDFKTQMQKFIKDPSYWRGNPSASQQDLMSIRSSARQAIEDMGDKYAGMAGQDSGQIKSINRGLGNNLQMEDILDDAVARKNANQDISLGDKAAAAAGAAAKGPVGLLAAPISAFARSKGNQLAATGANSMSKMLLSSPNFSSLSQSNPQAFEGLLGGLSARMSPSMSEAPKAVADEHPGHQDQANYDPSTEKVMPIEVGRNRFISGGQ